MTNKELHEEITRLKTALAELEEKVKVLPNSIDACGLPKPVDGQYYWFLSDTGEVYQSMWCADLDDHNRYSIGNCYPTKHSAEDALLVQILIQKARETHDGFVPDWENSAQAKYFLNFHMGDIGITDYRSINVAPTFGYWSDASICGRFVQDNHDELLWYFMEYRR